MLVGTILALAMIQSSSSYFLSEDSRNKKRAANNLAEAGVDYAYWQLHYKNKPLPFSADVTLSTGSFHVDATDDGNRDNSTIYIVSTGKYGSHSYTTKRVTLGLLPYHYAWCEYTDINDGNAITCTSSTRGMRTNSCIYLYNSSNNITTGLWATSSITTAGTATPKYAYSPYIAFPNIDYNYYSSIATSTYIGNPTFTSPSYPSGAVIYVAGTAYISGTYRGIITVIAAGDINVTGNLQPYDSKSHIALLTINTARLYTAAVNVNALVYVHRNDNCNGKIEIYGTKTITGSLGADMITADHWITISRDPTLDLDIMKQLHLPGL